MQKCKYCSNKIGKHGSLGMCNKHYIQYKRWGDPFHSGKKKANRCTIEGYYRDGKTGRREHRIIYEKHYGIKLLRSQIIHHINFNKTDNRIENLYLYENASEHVAAHMEYNKLKNIVSDGEKIVFENGRYKIEKDQDDIITNKQTEHTTNTYF